MYVIDELTPRIIDRCDTVQFRYKYGVRVHSWRFGPNGSEMDGEMTTRGMLKCMTFQEENR